MDLGLHTTLKDSTSKLDPEVLAIARRITPQFSPEFGTVWDLYGTKREPFETDEFEIYIRQYTQPEVEVQASEANADWDDATATSDLPVDSADVDKLTVGDVLLVNDEVVVVKEVDRSNNQIDVYERGAGDSDADAHGTDAIIAEIIGNAHEEGKVQSDARSEQTEKFTNYLQLVQEIVEVTKANQDQARKVGRTLDILKAEAMERVMKSLARTAIHGVARENTADKPGLTRGMVRWLEESASMTTNVAGSFTQSALDDELDEVRKGGGNVNAIAMSVANKRVFNDFTSADSVIQDVGEREAGRIVDYYLADGFGRIPVVVDIDMPDDKIALLDTTKMEKGWKVDDQLQFVEETNTNSRVYKENLQGKFGLAIKNVGTNHALLSGLTT